MISFRWFGSIITTISFITTISVLLFSIRLLAIIAAIPLWIISLLLFFDFYYNVCFINITIIIFNIITMIPTIYYYHYSYYYYYYF